jgi:hypothetical protein
MHWQTTVRCRRVESMLYLSVTRDSPISSTHIRVAPPPPLYEHFSRKPQQKNPSLLPMPYFAVERKDMLFVNNNLIKNIHAQSKSYFIQPLRSAAIDIWIFCIILRVIDCTFEGLLSAHVVLGGTIPKTLYISVSTMIRSQMISMHSGGASSPCINTAFRQNPPHHSFIGLMDRSSCTLRILTPIGIKTFDDQIFELVPGAAAYKCTYHSQNTVDTHLPRFLQWKTFQHPTPNIQGSQRVLSR